MANATWYMPLLGELLERVEFHPLSLPVPQGWSCFNPSVVHGEKGELLASVRSANYRIGPDGGYVVLREPIESRNFLVGLDEQLRVQWSYPIEPPSDSETFPFPVRGYEDLRLVSRQDSLYALAVVRDRHPSGLCQIALLEMGRKGAVRHERILKGPSPMRHEKNWVPFPLLGGESEFQWRTGLVYKWEPIVISELDLLGGEITWDLPALPSALGPDPRGGTQGVRVGGLLLFVVHYSVVMQDGKRRYPHQFIALDEKYHVAGASPMFFFLNRGVEFAAGLCIQGDDLLVSFGSEDARAWVLRCSLEAVLGVILT